MSLIGTLDEIRIGDVLRLFASSRKTGLLTATASGRETAIRFQKGVVTHASAGRLQGDDALLDVFGWKEGQLTFVPDEKAVAPNVSRTVDVAIAEGEAHGASFHGMNELITSDRISFQFSLPASPDARCSLGVSDWRVLRLVDGARDVRDLVEAAGLPKADVLRVLFELTEAGLIERVDSQKTLRAQVQGRFAKDAAEVDEKIGLEWRKLMRFTGGVGRVEVRTFARRGTALAVAFRAGVGRDVTLPRAAFTELGLREGEDVFVRPLA